MVDLLKLVKGLEEFVFPISEEDLCEIIKMVDEHLINKNVGLEIMDDVINTGKKPQEIVKEKNLIVTIGEDEISQILMQFKEKNDKVVQDYLKEPSRVIGFIVGQVMKKTGGKANPNLVKELIAKLYE